LVNSSPPIIPPATDSDYRIQWGTPDVSVEKSDRTTYGQKLKEAAEKLGVSVRTVQRLVKKWEQDGVVGFTQTGRADKGKHRIGEFWENFILKTYREGNKGSNCSLNYIHI